MFRVCLFVYHKVIDRSKVNGRHLGGGAVAAKITANVWEIVQLSNLVTPLLYNGI